MVKILAGGYYGVNVVFLDRKFNPKRILDATPCFPKTSGIVDNLERMLFFKESILLVDDNLTLYEIKSNEDLKVLWEKVFDILVRKNKAYILARDDFFVYVYGRGFFDPKAKIRRNIISEAISFDILDEKNGEFYYFLTEEGKIFRNNSKIVDLYYILKDSIAFYQIRAVSRNDFVVSYENDVGISLARVYKQGGSWRVNNIIENVTDPHFEVHYRGINPVVFASIHKRRKSGGHIYKNWIELAVINLNSNKIIRSIPLPCGVDYLNVDQAFYWVPSWFYEIIKNKELPPITKVQVSGR